MAEETENFSPLDPLGPAYGKINRPTLDVQGLSPFEGDRIRQEPINFPRPQFHPAMPGLNLTQPQQNVRKNVVGSPGVQPDQNKTATDDDIRRAHVDFITGSLQANKPKDDFAKIYSYDAGPDGNAFYKRYMAYGAETFDKIGFSPLRDNEAVFNSRTTIGDDWNRMMKHSLWPLLSTGFVDQPKSLLKMLSGDLTSPDLQSAREYEEAAAIGQSSKGGFLGFMSNTVMSFGYTAGIISEAILEEAAAALLAPETGGLSLFAATANNARKLKGIGAALEGMSAVRKGLSNMATITGARRAWSAVHDVGTTTKVGRFLNPFENTFDAFTKIKADNLTGLASLSKTAGGLYRDARSLNMAVSEARLEAGMVENKVYDQLYKTYYNDKGEAPDDLTQREMIKTAKDASLDTFYKNAILIYGSNKITFHNVVSPRGGIRNFIKSTVDDVATVGGGKFGNLGKIVYDNAKKSFAFEANNLKNLAKSWWKNPGFKTAGKTIGYFKANFTEGLQENAQEIIAGANEKYYIDSFNSKLRQAHEYSMGVADYNMKSQSQYYKEEFAKQNPFTAQGFETFASGFFMGVLAHPLNNAIPWLSVGYNRVFNKDEYTKYKDKKTEITENLVKTLNDTKIDEFLKSKLFDYGAQDIIGRIKNSGSKKEALDAEHESLILSMLGSGVTETYSDKIRSMNDLDDNEFMDAMNIEKDEIPAYRERVTYAANKMDRIRKTHNYYKDKYPNPVNPEMFKDMDKDSEEYQDMVALHYGWDLAVKNAVFFNETFEDTKNRMGDVEKKFLKSVNREKTGLRELGLLLSPTKLEQELQLLNTEIGSLKALPTLDRATQKELAKKEGLAKNIESYISSLNDFDNFYNRDQTFEAAKKEVSKKLGREATAEEVEKYVNRTLGKLDNENKQTKILDGLKKSFSDYAKFVSESNDDFAFDDNLEKAFTLLTDHYKLGAESRKMANYVNFLNNPTNIFEVAERNKNWMKGLYNRRKTYYRKMVKEQMKVVEHNALLNALADKGIFVPLDQFETWQKTGAVPSEFFNNVTKQVLVPGSEEYAYWSMFFLQANDLNVDSEEGDVTTTLDEPVELITPTSIQEVEAALKNLDAKQLVAKGNEYENVDDPNDKYARVSTLKGDFEGANKRAANRGTIIDDMLRGFINGTATKIEDIRKIYLDHPLKDQTQPFNAEFIRQLFAIFNEVKDIADNRGITLTAKIPTLWGTINGKKYAGTIDLLGIDKSGQVYIIDLKTSSQNRRDTEGAYFERYKENDTIQQSGYAELLRQRTGITVKSVTIFPVQVTIEDKVYTKAETNKDADGKFTMAVEIDRNIFPETPKAETKPEATPETTADTERRNTKVISSETVEKGIKKGQTRTVTQTNYTEDAEGTIVSVTEYEAKVGDTTVTLGGRAMTFKEFKEEFPLDEDYEEILGDWPDLNDDTIITVRKVKRTPSSSRFKTVVTIVSPVLGDKMDVTIKQDDTKYNDELAALEGKPTTNETEINAKIADIEKEREEEVNEFLRNVKNNKGERRFDNPDIQDQLEIKQYSRNVAKALAEGQPITFEFLKANLGARFTTNSSNVIIVDFNKSTGNIELSQEGTVSYIAVDKNNNISYDFEDRGKQIDLKKARPISVAEGTYQKELKKINTKYDAELDALEGAEKGEGISVGKARSEKATNKLAKLGFTDLMLDNMTESEITEALTYNTPEEVSEFREAIITKQRALDIYHPYITEFTLYKDAQLVANQTLLYKDETGEYVIFADTDDIVVVKSFDKETGEVVLQKLGSNVTLSVDISELDDVLMFKDQIMTEPEKAEETITNKKEAAEFTKEGNQVLDNFLGNNARQSEIEKGVENPEVTNDDLDDNLLKDLKCKK